MTSSVEVESLCIAGQEISLYRPAGPNSLPVALVYLLHGRCGSRKRVDAFAKKIVSSGMEHGGGGEGNRRQLWVVSFDHRNHGTRLVDGFLNEAWDSMSIEKHNPRHAVDMYSIQLGSAKDISLLTDLLPAYLFPNEENSIEEWAVVGISLGGHSAWLALSHDTRIRLGVPIIGCPDYLGLMEYRAEQNGLSLAPPHFPASLRQLVLEQDPVNNAYWSTDPKQNPFIGKKLMVLCGAEDELVPWTKSKDMVERLEMGATGVKKVRVYEGVGHKCTADMEDATVEFLRAELLI